MNRTELEQRNKMTEYVTVEFEHWYDIQKLLNARQPARWTLLRMPAAGMMGGAGLIVLELIEGTDTI